MTTLWSSFNRQHVSEKIDVIYKELLNLLGIADDILVVGYDNILHRVLLICRKNLKSNKDKGHFRHTSVSFFGKNISRQSVSPDLRNLKALTTDKLPPKSKKVLQAFLGIINYLGKFFLSTFEVYEPVRQLTSVKAEWTWNASYQTLFGRSKAIVKGDTCMKFHDETRPLYLVIDACDVGLGASLLQTRDSKTVNKMKHLTTAS